VRDPAQLAPLPARDVSDAGLAHIDHREKLRWRIASAKEAIMSASHLALLPDRGVVSVSGEDSRDFLDNLITNDMTHLDAVPAIHTGLLTPQGKILFEFFVARHDDGYLLETARAGAGDLVKRLTLYRLRAKVVLNDLSGSRVVVASWGGSAPAWPLATIYPDPRAEGLGYRAIMAPEMSVKLAAEDEGEAAFHRHRIALGVPEAGRDYALGDAFPHEAGFDRLAGVSFAKGCFVGQEVVARMQHKTIVRKRVVRIEGVAPLVQGSDVVAGDAVIGRVGSVDGTRALALVRLDRALEARRNGVTLVAAGTSIAVDAAALEVFAASEAARATPGA
jgi:tRNA-modifying protein YgfZ